jgi:6-pyruvoyltetrahydropterin/6-carboxytetrahydropterin synthase
MDKKIYNWVIDKSFDYCYGHRVWSQTLDPKYSLDSCLACRHLHGHQGKVKLFLGANNLKHGMVTDFKHTNIFKKWLDDTLDHKFIIDMNDPLFEDLAGDLCLSEKNKRTFDDLMVTVNTEYNFAIPDLEQLMALNVWDELRDDQKQAIFEKYEGIIIVDFIPTSENICKFIYEVANKMLNGLGIDVVAVEYWETPKSHCRYQPE